MRTCKVGEGPRMERKASLYMRKGFACGIVGDIMDDADLCMSRRINFELGIGGVRGVWVLTAIITRFDD